MRWRCSAERALTGRSGSGQAAARPGRMDRHLGTPGGPPRRARMSQHWDRDCICPCAGGGGEERVASFLSSYRKTEKNRSMCHLPKTTFLRG